MSVKVSWEKDAAWDNLKKSNPDITKEMKTAGFVVAREEEL